MPAGLTEPITTLLINNISCTATFVQYAGLAALTGPQDAVTRMVAGLAAKRDLLVRGLNAIDGIRGATPAGPFYCFPAISGVLQRTGLPCESFATRLLAERHVAVLAGSGVRPAGAGGPPGGPSAGPAGAGAGPAPAQRLVGAPAPPAPGAPRRASGAAPR